MRRIFDKVCGIALILATLLTYTYVIIGMLTNIPYNLAIISSVSLICIIATLALIAGVWIGIQIITHRVKIIDNKGIRNENKTY